MMLSSRFKRVARLQQQLMDQDTTVFARIQLQFWKDVRRWSMLHDTREGHLCRQSLRVVD
jgi:hypothetical protein